MSKKCHACGQELELIKIEPYWEEHTGLLDCLKAAIKRIKILEHEEEQRAFNEAWKKDLP